MPTIRQYTNEDNALQPGQGGAAATARAAIRMNALGQEEAGDIRRTGMAWQSAFGSIDQGLEKVGKVVTDWQTSKELSTFNAALMNTHAELDKEWSTTRNSTDPLQPAGPDFLSQSVTPKLDKLLDGVATKAARAHAEAAIQSAKMHYLHSATVDDQDAAGVGAVRNAQVVVDGATLRSQRDFTTVQYNSELIKSTFDAIIKNGNISPHAALKIGEARDKAVMENNIAGLKGAADRNPGAFVAQLKAGAFDNFGIDAKNVEQLLHYAKVQKAAHEHDARGAAIDAEIATRKQSEANFQKMLNGVKDVNDPNVWKDFSQRALNTPGFTSEDRVRLLHLSESRLKTLQDAQTGKLERENPRAEWDLMRRINDPTAPLTKEDIDAATRSPDLTQRITVNQGIKLYKDLDRSSQHDTKDAFKSRMAIIKEAMGEIRSDPKFDPKNGSSSTPYQFGAIGQRMGQMHDQLLQAGKDPREMLDPTSKLYFLLDPELRNIMKNTKDYDPAKIKQTPTKPLDFSDMFKGLPKK